MHRRGRVIRGDAHRGFAGEEAEREGESEGGEREISGEMEKEEWGV